MGSRDIYRTIDLVSNLYNSLCMKIQTEGEEKQKVLETILNFWLFNPSEAYELTQDFIIKTGIPIDLDLANQLRDFYDQEFAFSKNKYKGGTFSPIVNITLYLYLKVPTKADTIMKDLIDEYKTVINPNPRSAELVNYLSHIDYENLIAKVIEEDYQKSIVRK